MLRYQTSKVLKSNEFFIIKTILRIIYNKTFLNLQVDEINEPKNCGGSLLDAFMTEDQKKYVNAMKKAVKSIAQASLETSGHHICSDNKQKVWHHGKFFHFNVENLEA